MANPRRTMFRPAQDGLGFVSGQSGKERSGSITDIPNAAHYSDGDPLPLVPINAVLLPDGKIQMYDEQLSYGNTPIAWNPMIKRTGVAKSRNQKGDARGANTEL